MKVIGLFPDDSGWGNAIHWVRFPDKIAGWMAPRPGEGDLFKQRMKSDRTAILRLINVEYCDDPTDMFLADVEFVKYE